MPHEGHRRPGRCRGQHDGLRAVRAAPPREAATARPARTAVFTVVFTIRAGRAAPSFGLPPIARHCYRALRDSASTISRTPSAGGLVGFQPMTREIFLISLTHTR